MPMPTAGSSCPDNDVHRSDSKQGAVMMSDHARAGRLHVGIGGPVGSGKTALVEALCRALDGAIDLAAVTNDIYTREDADFLIRRAVLPPDRVRGVETGGCPHAAVRDDVAVNVAAIDELVRRHPGLQLVLGGSGPSSSATCAAARAWTGSYPTCARGWLRSALQREPRGEHGRRR